MSRTYSVKDWDSIFETAETRKLENLRWVPTPNKHDGLGFRTIAAERDRCDLFAAWNLILQIASKARRGERGALTRDGKAMTARDMALMTGFPESIFSRALLFFSTEVQWLVVVDDGEDSATATEPASNPGKSPARPASPPARPASSPAEGKEGIEGKEIHSSSPAAADGGVSDFESFWKAYPRKVGKQAALRAWKAAKGKPEVALIVDSIEQQKRSDQWQKDNGQFIPHPATWLNQGRWDDVPLKAPKIERRDSADRSAGILAKVREVGGFMEWYQELGYIREISGPQDAPDNIKLEFLASKGVRM